MVKLIRYDAGNRIDIVMAEKDGEKIILGLFHLSDLFGESSVNQSK